MNSMYSQDEVSRIKHQAMLFTKICQIASGAIQIDELPRRQIQIPNRPIIVGRRVYFGGQNLDLATSPLTLALFRLFLSEGERVISKYDIARFVYGVSEPEKLSERYWAATKVNINKLISRARKQTSEVLTRDGEGQEIGWFPYNAVGDGWHFYSLRPKEAMA